MRNWHEAISDDIPELIDTTTSPTTVYMRKDVRKETVKDDKGETRIEYHYQEKELTPIEYANKVSQDNADTLAKLEDVAMMTDVDLEEE